MHKTAIPMVRMLHTCLVIHGRCKFIMFSARTNVKFIRADIETLADQTLSEKSIKHCKTQCKINIFHIHTNKMQLASGEPPAFTLYINMIYVLYIYVIYVICIIYIYDICNIYICYMYYIYMIYYIYI